MRFNESRETIEAIAREVKSITDAGKTIGEYWKSILRSIEGGSSENKIL